MGKALCPKASHCRCNCRPVVGTRHRPLDREKGAPGVPAFVSKSAKGSSNVDEIAERVTTRVRQLLSDGFFPELRKGKTLSPRTLARAKIGFLKELPGIGKAVLVPSARVEKLIGRRGIFGLVVQRLADNGTVHQGDDGKPTRQVLVKGLAKGRPRYVCFRFSCS